MFCGCSVINIADAIPGCRVPKRSGAECHDDRATLSYRRCWDRRSGRGPGSRPKGLNVIVLEKSSRLGEIGAGIQLGPNAFHSFDYLGVGDAARAMAVFIDQLRLMDAINGEEIVSMPLDEPFRKRFGNPYAVVHRGDLHGVLLTACRRNNRIDLRVNSELSYEQDGAGVTARLSSGASRQPAMALWRHGSDRTGGRLVGREHAARHLP
jgi:hypothetical protein